MRNVFQFSKMYYSTRRCSYRTQPLYSITYGRQSVCIGPGGCTVWPTGARTTGN